MTPHCPTCVCDPTSKAARDRTNQIAPFKIDRYSWLYCTMTLASAHKEMVEYFQKFRPIARTRPGAPRLIEVAGTSLVAEHQLVVGDYMPVLIHRPGPAPTVHKRSQHRAE